MADAGIFPASLRLDKEYTEITEKRGIMIDHKLLKIREEKSLVKRCLTGDQLAWKTVLVRYRSIIYKVINVQLAKFNKEFGKVDKDEVFANVCEVLHKRAFAAYVKEGEYEQVVLSTFLYKVSANVTKDYIKGKEVQKSMDTNSMFNDEGECVIDMPALETTFDIVVKQEQRELLYNEISNLSIKDQTILCQYIQGHTGEETAKELGINANVVAKAIHQFKKAMIKKYQGKKNE